MCKDGPKFLSDLMLEVAISKTQVKRQPQKKNRQMTSTNFKFFFYHLFLVNLKKSTLDSAKSRKI